MRTLLRSALLIAVMLITLSLLSNAQDPNPEGFPNFGMSDAYVYDSVNLATNAISLSLSIRSKAGAWPFTFNLHASSSAYPVQDPNSNSGIWQMTMLSNDSPTLIGGKWAWGVNGILGEYYTGPVYTIATPDGNCGIKYSGWVMRLYNGTSHPLDPSFFTTGISASGCQYTATGVTVDGSGITVTAQSNTGTAAYLKDGTQIWGGFHDRNGNTFSFNLLNPFIFKDSMGLPTVTATRHAGDYYLDYSWVDINGSTRQVTTNTATYGVLTSYGCTTGPWFYNNKGQQTGINEYSNSSMTLPSGFTLADQTSLSIGYEPNPNNSAFITGRIGTITTPQGGTITYKYPVNPGGFSGPNMICGSYTPGEVDRVLANGDTTKYVMWYHPDPNNAIYPGTLYSDPVWFAENWVTDASGNDTRYSFSGFTIAEAGLVNGNIETHLENGEHVLQPITKIERYSGAAPGNYAAPQEGSYLEAELYCYNNTFSACATSRDNGLLESAWYTYPITSRIVFKQLQGMTTWSATEEHYDQYGNVTYSAAYEYGQTSPTGEITTAFGTWNGSACVGLTNTHVLNTPCDRVTKLNGNNVAEVRLTYNANGNLAKTSVWNGSTFIGQTTSNTWNSNGTPSKTFDLNNNETDYAYVAAQYQHCSGCSQYPFPTKITNAVTGNYTAHTYYGDGGVVASTADRNGATTVYSYAPISGAADPYWRPMIVTVPNGKVTTNTYPSESSPDTASTLATFNGGNSIEGAIYTTDGWGRAINEQEPQSAGGSTYDTYTTSYFTNGFFGTQPNTPGVASTAIPCSTTLNSTCQLNSFSYNDPLGRITQNGTSCCHVSHAYAGLNDEAFVSNAAGTNLHGFDTFNTQYDVLGRPVKQCDGLYNSGNLCGMANFDLGGVLTTYAYSSTSGSTTARVTKTDYTGSNPQTRTTVSDALGRPTSIQIPEASAAKTYFYDNQTSGCSGATASKGNLICKKDGINQTVYVYDAQNRITDVGAGVGGSTLCRRLRYDNSSGVLGSLPSGVTLSNQYGRLVEAETDTCAQPITQASMITDEWFAYDSSGNISDIWEKTPHSTQYYHSSATFYENGAVKTVNLAAPSFYTMSFSIDGKGRLSGVTDSTHGKTIASGATYFPAANPATTTVFGTDSDSFTYDGASGSGPGRMTEYKFTIGGKTYTGDLTWSTAGPQLAQLVTTDGFNAAGSMTCVDFLLTNSNIGYDSWGRLIGYDCGAGNWGQSFAYDAFDNMTKAQLPSRGGTTWNVIYDANNHFNVGTYDVNGNVISDGNFNYGWDPFGKMAWVAGSGTPTCGSSGRCATYDAMGRMVETSNNAAFTERWYTQAGWVSMNGATINFAYWPAPHNAKIYEGGNGANFQFMHPDWLGTKRVTSTGAHAVSGDVAYSPYGEVMATLKNPATGLKDYTGLTQNFDPGVMWDADNRELSVANNRWLSPDPAGAGWNQYAYVTDPNSNIDPLGLDGLPCVPGNCPDPPGPPCDPDFGCDPGCDPDFGCGPPILPPPPGPPGGTPPSNPPNSNPPSETTPGVNYNAPWWREWGSLPPWLSGTWGGQIALPPDTNGCEFGNVCAPLGSEFTPGAVPWGTLAGWGVRIGTWADAVAGLLPGLLLMETGDNAPHQMSNLSENRKFGYAIQEIGRRCGGALTDDQVRRLHDEITRGGYTTDEIIEIGVAMFCPGS